MLDYKAILRILMKCEAKINKTIKTANGAVMICSFTTTSDSRETDIVVKLYDLTEKGQMRYECFVSEIKSYLRLIHTFGVVPVLDFGCYDEFAFIIMMHSQSVNDTNSHVTLRDVINDKNCSIEEAAKYAFYLSYALGSIVSNWKIFSHGDIKPDNILLFADIPHLIDFETATFDANNKTPKTSLPYRAPELFIADGIVNEKTDVYSFGVLFYELIENINVASGDNEEHYFEEWRNFHKKHKKQTAKQKSTYEMALLDLIKKCVNTEPSERPSFSGVLLELESIMSIHDSDNLEQCKRTIGNLTFGYYSLKAIGFGFIQPNQIFTRLMSMGEYAFVAQYFDFANSKNPYYSSMAKAISLDEEFRYSESIELYQSILEKQPLVKDDEITILCNLALAYKHNKNFEEAKEIFHQLLGIVSDRDYNGMFSNYMTVFIEEGDYVKAIKLGEKRVSNNPDNDMVWANLAIAYIYSKDAQKAKFAIKRLFDINPNSQSLLTVLAKYKEEFGGNNA